MCTSCWSRPTDTDVSMTSHEATVPCLYVTRDFGVSQLLKRKRRKWTGRRFSADFCKRWYLTQRAAVKPKPETALLLVTPLFEYFLYDVRFQHQQMVTDWQSAESHFIWHKSEHAISWWEMAADQSVCLKSVLSSFPRWSHVFCPSVS